MSEIQEEEILKENPNRFTIFPIKYKDLWDFYQQHLACFWTSGDIDFEAIVKLSDGFNGADLRNVCTEGGIFAIRANRDYVLEEDLLKACRKMAEAKKLESKLDYSKV